MMEPFADAIEVDPDLYAALDLVDIEVAAAAFKSATDR